MARLSESEKAEQTSGAAFEVAENAERLADARDSDGGDDAGGEFGAAAAAPAAEAAPAAPVDASAGERPAERRAVADVDGRGVVVVSVAIVASS